jgi:5-methylcytosine-specific restriction endonuclease McrA
MDIEKNQNYFTITVSDKEIRKEREKARQIRKKQWWQNELNKGVCYYCGKTFPKSELTMDHIVPIIRGGKSTKGNIVVACKNCNNKKKYMLPLEWEEYLNKIKATE